MYNNRQKMKVTDVTGIEAYNAETIEDKVRRLLNNKEPITDGAPLIFTDRKEGVKPSYNIRTDRWEVAVDGMDTVSRAHIARREERGKVIEMKKDGGPEPIQGTDKV